MKMANGIESYASADAQSVSDPRAWGPACGVDGELGGRHAAAPHQPCGGSPLANWSVGTILNSPEKERNAWQLVDADYLCATEGIGSGYGVLLLWSEVL